MKLPSERVVTIASVVISGLFLLFYIFQWDLIHLWTPFLHYPAVLTIWGAMAFSTLLSLICGVARLGKSRGRSLLPLLLNVGAFCAVWFVPIDSIMLDLNFRWNFDKRTEIVKRIEAGEFPINRNGLAQLPWGYRHLSRGGGEVIVARQGDTRIVFFFTYRGILDNFSGFFYRSDADPPNAADVGGDFKEIKKLRDHWYWAASW